MDLKTIKLGFPSVENRKNFVFLKNFMFAGSHSAAERIAMMYSFFGSCKAHGVNPYEWLKSTLERIADTKLSDLEKLLPGRI